MDITEAEQMLKAESDAALAVADWADLMIEAPDGYTHSRAALEKAVETYRAARQARRDYFAREAAR